MGNRTTSETYLKHMRVRRQKVLDAFRWPKLHHSGYPDIKIQPETLDWMNDKSVASVQSGNCRIKVEECVPHQFTEFVSRVQCARDFEKEHDLEFSTLVVGDMHTIPNIEQSQPIYKLMKVAKKSGEEEVVLKFLPHSDTPVK